MTERQSKHDRELIELLTELRVVLPGIQVLFAFLLAVPFAQGWTRTTAAQRDVFFWAFVLTTLATLLLIAPTAMHRIRWRAHDKEHLLLVSNRLAIAGTAVLAGAMSCVVYFLTDYIRPGVTAITTGVFAGLFVLLWFVYPLSRAVLNKDDDN